MRQRPDTYPTSRPARGPLPPHRLSPSPVLALVDAIAITLLSSILTPLPLPGDPDPLTRSLLSVLVTVAMWTLVLNLSGVFTHRTALRLFSSPRSYLLLVLLGHILIGRIQPLLLGALPPSPIGALLVPVSIALIHEMGARLPGPEEERGSRALLLVPQSNAVPLEELITRNGERLGVRITGVMAWDDHEPLTAAHLLANTKRIIAAMEDCGAGVLLLASLSAADVTDLQTLRWRLEDAGLSLALVLEPSALAPDLVTISSAPGVTMFRARARVDAPLEAAAVRGFDLLVSSLLILLLAPVWVIVPLLIRREDHGPAYFIQTRVGRGGRPFRMMKFRSMAVDAEERLAALRERERGRRRALGEEEDPDTGMLFKLVDDPRATRIGRFLRRTSIDELPQLFNVWRGDMSLVGPRPPLLHEVDHYEARIMRKFNVRPGITGLWQVSGRSELPWNEAVRLDLYYVEHRSFAFNLRILWRTLGVVLRQEGAY